MRAARVHHASRRRGCAWPLAAGAQQPAMPVVGVPRFRFARDEHETASCDISARACNEAGYVEGENVAIEYAGPKNQYRSAAENWRPNWFADGSRDRYFWRTPSSVRG